MSERPKGMVMYENDKNIVVDLHLNGNQTTAFIDFSGLRIDLSDIAVQAVLSPMSFDKMHQLMWKRIVDAVNKIKGERKYSSVFTRLEVGSGYAVLRNRMTYMVSFIYNRYYTHDERKESERKHEHKNIYTSIDWRIGGQDYDFRN